MFGLFVLKAANLHIHQAEAEGEAQVHCRNYARHVKDETSHFPITCHLPIARKGMQQSSSPHKLSMAFLARSARWDEERSRPTVFLLSQFGSFRFRDYGAKMLLVPNNVNTGAGSWTILLILFNLAATKFVNAIQCYTCDAAHFNHECNSTENVRQCPITYDTCITLLRYSSEVRKMQISKRCSKRDSCNTQSNALQVHAPCDSSQPEEWACVHCCDTDLCNFNTGNSNKRSSYLLFKTVLLLKYFLFT